MLRQEIIDMDDVSLRTLRDSLKVTENAGLNQEETLSWIDQELGRRDLAEYQRQAHDLWFSGGSCTGGKPE